MDFQEKDNLLWKLAKKRAGFKWSLAAYIFVNVSLTAIWFFTEGTDSYFWPFWSMFGWGIGIGFQYLNCYHSNSMFSVQAEYEYLKKQNQL
jgi:2TM domain-containing protein